MSWLESPRSFRRCPIATVPDQCAGFANELLSVRRLGDIAEHRRRENSEKYEDDAWDAVRFKNPL
ncbi:MAG: hypothetical protein R6U98_27305, partial [Pirellulaceae bacterium]